MKIFRYQVIDMFEEIGYFTADKWSEEKMLRKLKHLPTILKKVEDLDHSLEKDRKTGEPKLLLNQVCIAIENGEEIELDYSKGIKEMKKEKNAKKEKIKKPAIAHRTKKISTKEIIYREYIKIKDKKNCFSKAEKWMTSVDKKVKLATVKAWVSAWNHGKNLPSCAKKTA